MVFGLVLVLGIEQAQATKAVAWAYLVGRQPIVLMGGAGPDGVLQPGGRLRHGQGRVVPGLRTLGGLRAGGE